jgi:hypothetical protein
MRIIAVFIFSFLLICGTTMNMLAQEVGNIKEEEKSQDQYIKGVWIGGNTSKQTQQPYNNTPNIQTTTNPQGLYVGGQFGGSTSKQTQQPYINTPILRIPTDPQGKNVGGVIGADVPQRTMPQLPPTRVIPTIGVTRSTPTITQALESIKQHSPETAERLLFLIQLESEINEKTKLLEEARKNGDTEVGIKLEEEINSLRIRMQMEMAQIGNEFINDTNIVHTGGGSVEGLIMFVFGIINRQKTYPAPTIERSKRNNVLQRTDSRIEKQQRIINKHLETITNKKDLDIIEKRLKPPSAEEDI